QVIKWNPAELFGDASQRSSKAALVIEHAQDHVASANRQFVELQRGKQPCFFDGHFKVIGETRNAIGAAWQPIERRLKIRGDLRCVQIEGFDDVVKIGVLQHQDLVDEMLQLNRRIAARLAEDRGALGRAVGQAVELRERVFKCDI